MENIQKIVTDELHTLTENDFRYCYDQWKKRNHFLTSQASYFEGALLVISGEPSRHLTKKSVHLLLGQPMNVLSSSDANDRIIKAIDKL
jgi:hypothetical protein